MDSFNKAWQQYCRHYFPQLFDMCVANRDQMRVCATFEKATAMPNIQPIKIHNSEAQAHATADTLDQPSKLDVDRSEGNSIVQTAGSLSEQTILDPGFFLVIAGRMLVVIDNPINAPGLVLAILSSGHQLVAAPGTRIGMYTIGPTIMFGQSFLNYRCLDFIHREEASLELKVYPIWMGAALPDPLWMASLGHEQAVMAQEWTREALQKMADDMVVKRIQGRAREHPTVRRFLTRHMASRTSEYSRAVVVVMQLQQTVMAWCRRIDIVSYTSLPISYTYSLHTSLS